MANGSESRETATFLDGLIPININGAVKSKFVANGSESRKKKFSLV
jgi:hypothetical protein